MTKMNTLNVETLSEKDIYARIKAALDPNFVKFDDIAYAIALGIASKRSVLLFGPGGHGKSEMTQAALEAVESPDQIHTQSFGEGSSEAYLWGGIDFGSLKPSDGTKATLRYHAEASFLSKRLAVFEEIFDAPTAVITSLKDTMTARMLRKGSQQVPMLTRCIIGITNKNPSELSQLGPSAAALVERFPIQLEVIWPEYSASDYLELFNKVNPHLGGATIRKSRLAALADLFAKCVESGEDISPRTSVYALQIVRQAAQIRGAKEVEEVDLQSLRFIPGLKHHANDIMHEIEEAMKRAEAEAKLDAIETEYRGIVEKMAETVAGKKLFLIAGLAGNLEDLTKKLLKLQISDELVNKRDSINSQIINSTDEAWNALKEAARHP